MSGVLRDAAWSGDADLEARDGRRRPPLMRAVTEKRVAVTRALVAMRADPSTAAA